MTIAYGFFMMVKIRVFLSLHKKYTSYIYVLKQPTKKPKSLFLTKFIFATTSKMIQPTGYTCVMYRSTYV